VHHYYHREGKTDLSKMRDDALARLNGTGMYRGAREESVIHLHPKYAEGTTGKARIEPEEVLCGSFNHEGYYTEGMNHATVIPRAFGPH
jgi:5-methylcytosine-specific restriction endonuclease McrA